MQEKAGSAGRSLSTSKGVASRPASCQGGQENILLK